MNEKLKLLEREACAIVAQDEAEICNAVNDKAGRDVAYKIASTIRARSKPNYQNQLNNICNALADSYMDASDEEIEELLAEEGAELSRERLLRIWDKFHQKLLADLAKQSLELCWAIEELPASEQQTEISIKAAKLNQDLTHFPWRARPSAWTVIRSEDDLPKDDEVISQWIVTLQHGASVWVESVRFYGGEWIDYHGDKTPLGVKVLAYQKIEPYREGAGD